MKSIMVSLLLASTLSLTTLAGPIRQNAKKVHPTKLVHFEVGALITGSGKLRVNVDKELGGLVYIQLMDRHGYVYFNRTVYADEEMARLNMDLSNLVDNDYVLKVSNGLEVVTRDIKINTIRPILQTKSIKIQ
jgi:aspartyl-tRNA synthetase